ncbi:CPBP family intramembrane glutamic endopeptidase [Tsuneonella dongtanensis]|nr:type II CAAX endopeptidase family protein [Tsuneonella dongtanensis]
MRRRVLAFPLVAMILALIAVIGPIFAFALTMQTLPLDVFPEDVALSLVLIGATLISIVMYKIVVTRLGESPRDDLPFDVRMHDGWLGAVYAALLMSAIVGVVALLGGYAILGWGGSTSWPMLLFGAGLQAAFVEEIVARGILFRFLEEFGGSWFALAASSALFGFAHASNDNASTFSSLAISLEAGVLLGGAYMLTRDLWLPIGIHFGWNVTQGYLWDVPVSGAAVDGLVEAETRGPELISGGAFGVEASIVAIVVATAVGLWLVVLAARRGHVVRPWWVRRRLARAGEAKRP